MISKQAESIKKELLQNKNLENVLNTPLEVQRKKWEASASTDVIPEGIFIDKAIIGNISTERIFMNKSNKNAIILYFHGGGLCQGSIITHRKLASHIAKGTNVPVLVHDYPLAPEDPYPAALYSSEQLYLYLLNNGYQSENVLFGGDSTGCGLALSLALLLKDKNVSLPGGIFLLSPMVDFTLSGDTLDTYAEKDPLVFKEDLQLDVNRYLENESPLNPLVSPIYGDLKGFPPLFIQAGSDEVLLSDSTRLADKAKASQVDVQLSVWEGIWHVFQAWVGVVPEADDAIEKISEFIKTIFN